MDQLVKGMLAIGPWFSPNDWSSVIVDSDSIFGDVFTVRLHVALTTTCIHHYKSITQQVMLS